MWIGLVCIATDNNQMHSRKMFPCSVMSSHRVKSKFYCTAKLMITKWLNILIPFAFPSIYSHEQVKYVIVPSQQQHVGQSRPIETCMLNTASC